MKIKPLALALTAGIFWGAAVMLATWWLLIRGSGGSTIVLLGNFYLGYSFSWIGSIIGLIWGFVDGFICGYLFALLYNVFAKE
ncbi:MAG: bacteriophage holin [Candidatus Electryonea clarkiae]|nr:bacteriophage holin [Candidatus Electryonea clarkiae]MDP8288245.1 bacteriophage holin [Candidatus Electryonea clarkiae]